MKLQVNDGGKAIQTETSLDPDVGQGLHNVSYIYETNRCTHTHRSAWSRRQTHKHVYLIRIRMVRFTRGVSGLVSGFPNRGVLSVRQTAQKWNTATRGDVCSSKGRLRLIHHAFKHTAVR